MGNNYESTDKTKEKIISDRPYQLECDVFHFTKII